MEEVEGGKEVRKMVEEWVILRLFGKDTLVCGNCSGALTHQKVHMHLNVDREIEEVLCAGCYKSRREEDGN